MNDHTLDSALIESQLNGDGDYIERKAAEYLLTLMDAIRVESSVAYRFCAAAAAVFSVKSLREYGFLGGDAEPKKGKKQPSGDKDPPAYINMRKAPANAVDPADWAAIRTYLEQKRDSIDPATDMPVLMQNFLRLADRIGLGAEEKDALTFFLVAEGNGLAVFMDTLCHENRKPAGLFMAHMLGRRDAFRKMDALLSPSSVLIRYGLLYLPAQAIDGFLSECDPDLRMCFESELLDDDALMKAVLGVPVASDLGLDDFRFIGDELDFIGRLIEKSVGRGESGINILLYGPPGGGKTELAKAIAAGASCRLYAVGEDDGPRVRDRIIYRDLDDDTTSEIGPGGLHDEGTVSRKRLSQLMRAQALLRGNPQALILFDEIEDILLKGTDAEKKADTESKIQINRLLETNPVVTIWVGNDTDKLHPAVRDRFAYSLYVDYPPTLVRQKIWERQMMLHGLQMPAEDVRDLARGYDATPRHIAKAVRAAAITGGGKAAVLMSLPASSKITSASSEALSSGGRVSRLFSPALLRAREGDAGAILDGLVDKGRARIAFSLMAQGAKGTGVDSMLRFLGERLSMNLLEVSMKNLAQPSMMSTPEANVAGVFIAAADERRFLVVKDVEYLVPSPQSAGAQWHNNSLVERFMHHAVRHRFPFAVTCREQVTLSDSLLFLFSDRICLDPLDDGRARQAFRIFFGRDVPQGLVLPEGLTPADFSIVRRMMARSGAQGEEISLLARQKALRMSAPPAMRFV